MALGIAFVVVLLILLGAVYVIRPRRFRFSLGVPKVFEVRLEVDNDDP